MPQPQLPQTARGCYFERPAEKLVLEGYRCWTRGFALRSTEPWTQAQLLYRELLDPDAATTAIVALADFVKTLGLCAACPLRMFGPGSRHICRDEALVMGLIAGIQNFDEPTVEHCLSHLACRRRCHEVATAAGNFALTLSALDMRMMPLPARILMRFPDRCAGLDEKQEPAGRPTLH